MKTKKIEKNHCHQFKLTAIGVLLTTAAFAHNPNPDLLVCYDKGYTIGFVEGVEGVASATGSALTYTWYQKVESGSYSEVESAGSTATIHVDAKNDAPGTYSYVRKVKGENCPDEISSNTYTIYVLKPTVPVISVNSAATVCQSFEASSVTFSISSQRDDHTTYTWTRVSGQAGTFSENTSSYTVYGNISGASSFNVVMAAASVTYTINDMSKVCSISATTGASVTIHPFPTVTVTSSTTFCGSGTQTLKVDVKVNTDETVTESSTINWYSVKTDGSALNQSSSSSYTTPNPLTETTTYYVEAKTAAGCVTQSRTEVKAKVNAYEGVIKASEDD